MPYIDIDIDVDSFYNECSDREKKWLVDLLKEDGFMGDDESERSYGIHNDYWFESIEKLKTLRLQLSKEDMEKINEILKKY